MQSTPDNLDFSGEQVIPGKTNSRIEDEHLERYEFAKNFVKDKIVLDVACGVGYGTKMIKNAGAQAVYGVDNSDRVIEYARKYFAADKIKYICGDATKLNFQNNFFDVVISFETIEHLNDSSRNSYLQELLRVLKNQGVLILSTPNRRITSPGSNKPLNKYHVKEYNIKELKDVLYVSHFEIVNLYGQRVRKKLLSIIIVRKFVSLIERILRRRFVIYDIAHGPEVIKYGKSYEPRYFVVIARPIQLKEAI